MRQWNDKRRSTEDKQVVGQIYVNGASQGFIHSTDPPRMCLVVVIQMGQFG